MMGGSIPVKDGIELGQRYGLLQIKAGNLILTDYSANKLLPLCQEREPSTTVLRELYGQVIRKNRYHWLLFFNEDMDVFRVGVPQDWIDLLEAADLFSTEDDSVADWWRSLLESYQEYDAEKAKQIGDIGERLTITHERMRLALDEITGLHARIKWVARFSGDAGYDVLSVRGSRYRAQCEMLDQIQIEVKSSALSQETSFSFKVTKNEWKTALLHLDSYFFYCWLGVSLTKGTATKGPFVIPARLLSSSFPIDTGDICEWTECRVVFDLTSVSSG